MAMRALPLTQLLHWLISLWLETKPHIFGKSLVLTSILYTVVSNAVMDCFTATFSIHLVLYIDTVLYKEENVNWYLACCLHGRNLFHCRFYLPCRLPKAVASVSIVCVLSAIPPSVATKLLSAICQFKIAPEVRAKQVMQQWHSWFASR